MLALWREYAGPGPLNTDNNQRIAFDAAPAALIAQGPEFHKTLASLMPYRRQFPDTFVTMHDAGSAAPLFGRALRPTIERRRII